MRITNRYLLKPVTLLKTCRIKQMEKEKKLSAWDIVQDLSNDQLRSLVKEMSNISASAHEKKSQLLIELFEAEEIEYRTWSDEIEYRTWSDVFSEVDLAVKTQIMNRIKNDKF